MQEGSPLNTTPPLPPQDAAVLVHGLTDHRNGFVLPQLARALAPDCSPRSLVPCVPPQDAAVLVHGLTDHRDGFVLPRLAAALAGAGVCSLRLDMRGNGESEGDFEFANMRDEARPLSP